MSEKKELPSLPFGKKIQVGSFTVLKYTRSLTKNQLKQLRDSQEIHPDVRKRLTRAGLPYIKVETISQMWSVEFCCNTGVFAYLDFYLPQALLAADAGVELEENSLVDILHIFGMWMTDTCTQGDSIYYQDKANAVHALIERKTAAKKAAETAEAKVEDDKILEEEQASEEAKAQLVEMVKDLKEKGGEYAN